MFEPMLDCTFLIYELKKVNISYAVACYQAQLSVDYVVTYINDDIVYKTKGYGTTVFGPKSLLNY